MGEEILTDFIGDGCIQCVANYPDGWPKGVTDVRPYPKWKFWGKNIPFLGNIREDVTYVDKPIFDIYGRATGKKKRYIFMDQLGNIDLKSAKNIPGIVDVKNKLESTELLLDEMSLKFVETLERFGYKMQDDRIKTLVDELELSKEAKKKLWSIIDMGRSPQQ